MPWEIIVAFALGLVLLYVIGWLFLIPPRFVWRLIAGGMLGGLSLWLINQFSAITGLIVAVNPITALTVGFLGVPGVALVVVLQTML